MFIGMIMCCLSLLGASFTQKVSRGPPSQQFIVSSARNRSPRWCFCKASPMQLVVRYCMRLALATCQNGSLSGVGLPMESFLQASILSPRITRS